LPSDTIVYTAVSLGFRFLTLYFLALFPSTIFYRKGTRTAVPLTTTTYDEKRLHLLSFKSFISHSFSSFSGRYTDKHLSRQLYTDSPPSTTLKIKNLWQIWHSFKVWPSFCVTRVKRTVNLTEYFDLFKEDIWWKTSYTIRPEPWMSDYIKKWGWQMISEESLWIARRQVKKYPVPLSQYSLLV
jgi:hypothetical protein